MYVAIQAVLISSYASYVRYHGSMSLGQMAMASGTHSADLRRLCAATRHNPSVARLAPVGTLHEPHDEDPYGARLLSRFTTTAANAFEIVRDVKRDSSAIGRA